MSAAISPSPLLELTGAVSGDGIDAPVAAHYGSFNREAKMLDDGEGFVDLSHHDVVRLTGPDRLTWLHNLTTQHLLALGAGEVTQALILSPNGHVEHEFHGVDDGDDTFLLWTEPGTSPALVDFLEKMKFMTRVEISDVTADLALTWRPANGFRLIERAELSTYAAAAGPPAGLWAFEALRIARGEARFGLDTDQRTIPNEVGWIGAAVHLDKGCYRGQETVARVHTLGRPPRRLTLLHLDGTENRLPTRSAEVHLAGDDGVDGETGKVIGWVGSSARHHELGPIALAVLKRNTPVDAPLLVDGIAAAQEVVVDPEVGLHVRPLRG